LWGAGCRGCYWCWAFPMHAARFLGGVKGHLRWCGEKRRKGKSAAERMGQPGNPEPAIRHWAVEDRDCFPQGRTSFGSLTTSPQSRTTLETESTIDSPAYCPEGCLASSPREPSLLAPYYTLAALMRGGGCGRVSRGRQRSGWQRKAGAGTFGRYKKRRGQ
jgi:hypothetical protein